MRRLPRAVVVVSAVCAAEGAVCLVATGLYLARWGMAWGLRIDQWQRRQLGVDETEPGRLAAVPSEPQTDDRAAGVLTPLRTRHVRPGRTP